MSMEKAQAFVDISDVVCPVTFVKVKVAIEDLEDGQIIEILMNEGEPVQNVPRSLKDEGHKVLRIKTTGMGLTPCMWKKAVYPCRRPDFK
jgi:Predicted redox protein, regulator of disulfide bond formation